MNAMGTGRIDAYSCENVARAAPSRSSISELEGADHACRVALSRGGRRGPELRLGRLPV